MRQWERRNRGGEGQAGGGGNREGGRARAGSQVGVGGRASGLLYLHKGSQYLPGFLVDLLSIPVRVESLKLNCQPVVLSEKESVGSGQQDLLGGSGIS